MTAPITDLHDSPMSRVDYWVNQLTGTAPENDLARFWFHVNGLAEVAHQLDMSAPHVMIHVANAIAADCECER